MNLRWAVLAAFVSIVGASAQTARWVETQAWTGEGTRQTEVFVTHGSRWRVRYRPRGKGLFQIAVYDATGRLANVAADLQQPIGGIATFQQHGEFFLAITAIDASWSVKVEQYLTVIEEWQLMQAMRRDRPALAKLGTWTGQAGEVEYEVTVPHGSWQILWQNAGDSSLNIILEDEQGGTTLAAATRVAGESSSWVHRAGTFKLRITAVDPGWKVDVFGEAE